MFYQANEFNNPLTNANNYDRQRVSFTNSTQDKGIYGLRGGGLKTDDNNPMLKESGLDKHLLDKQPQAIKEEIEEMGEKKTEPVDEKKKEGPGGVVTPQKQMSGTVQQLNMTPLEDAKHSSEVKQSPEVIQSPKENKAFDNELPDKVKNGIKNFGKPYKKEGAQRDNTARRLIEYDKDFNIVKTYKSIQDFNSKLSNKETRLTFTHRGQYHTLANGHTIVTGEPKD